MAEKEKEIYKKESESSAMIKKPEKSEKSEKKKTISI